MLEFVMNRCGNMPSLLYVKTLPILFCIAVNKSFRFYYNCRIATICNLIDKQIVIARSDVTMIFKTIYLVKQGFIINNITN